MTFLIFMSILLYVIVGTILMPMFTRASFNSLSKEFDKKYAQKKCGMAGFEKSLIWPVTLSIHMSMRKINREIESAEKKEQERKETERILKEFEDNDPVKKEFKRLEEEEKQKAIQEQNDRWAADVREIKAAVDKLPKKLDQKAVATVRAKQEAGMVLDEKGIWDYPVATAPKSAWEYPAPIWPYSRPDVYEIRNFDGSIVMSFEEAHKEEQMDNLRDILASAYNMYKMEDIDVFEYEEIVMKCEEEAQKLGFSLD